MITSFILTHCYYSYPSSYYSLLIYLYTCISAYIILVLLIVLCTGGVDYEAGPYFIDITKGDESAEFCINIFDDNELKNGQFFQLFINTTALPTQIIHKMPHSATVSILDDKCKQYYV